MALHSSESFSDLSAHSGVSAKIPPPLCVLLCLTLWLLAYHLPCHSLHSSHTGLPGPSTHQLVCLQSLSFCQEWSSAHTITLTYHFYLLQFFIHLRPERSPSNIHKNPPLHSAPPCLSFFPWHLPLFNKYYVNRFLSLSLGWKYHKSRNFVGFFPSQLRTETGPPVTKWTFARLCVLKWRYSLNAITGENDKNVKYSTIDKLLSII